MRPIKLAFVILHLQTSMLLLMSAPLEPPVVLPPLKAKPTQSSDVTLMLIALLLEDKSQTVLTHSPSTSYVVPRPLWLQLLLLSLLLLQSEHETALIFLY